MKVVRTFYPPPLLYLGKKGIKTLCNGPYAYEKRVADTLQPAFYVCRADKPVLFYIF